VQSFFFNFATYKISILTKAGIVFNLQLTFFMKTKNMLAVAAAMLLMASATVVSVKVMLRNSTDPIAGDNVEALADGRENFFQWTQVIDGVTVTFTMGPEFLVIAPSRHDGPNNCKVVSDEACIKDRQYQGNVSGSVSIC